MTNQNPKNNVLAETKQVGKFGAVGIINTLLDFGIYNVLFVSVGLPLVVANLISTTIAMTFSFFANKTLVFRSKNTQVLKQALQFLAVTAFGLYVIQTGIIYLLANVWQWPLEFGYDIVGLLRLDNFFSREFVFGNGAKVIGTVFSLVWNYILYKKVVFKT